MDVLIATFVVVVVIWRRVPYWNIYIPLNYVAELLVSTFIVVYFSHLLIGVMNRCKKLFYYGNSKLWKFSFFSGSKTTGFILYNVLDYQIMLFLSFVVERLHWVVTFMMELHLLLFLFFFNFLDLSFKCMYSLTYLVMKYWNCVVHMCKDICICENICTKL